MVAVGEVGYDSMTPAEDEAFTRQLAMAIDAALPVMVHTPHRDKLVGTRRTLDVVRESGIAPGMVVVDHLNETNVALVKDAGAWMGFSIYPDTKMDEHRMVAILLEHGTDRVLVNSAADWGRSDPSRRSRPGGRCSPRGSATTRSTRSCGATPSSSTGNPAICFSTPSRVRRGRPARGGVSFEGSSVLRGARV
ncbi:TatD family hydrolase [Oerskovia sp. M15]